MNDAQPSPSRELERLQRDVDRWGYCLIERALDEDVLQRVRRRLAEQARAEREHGVEYRNPGHLDNQWVNMLLNKGRVFERLVTHPIASRVVEHILGPEYLVSCCDAQIKHPGSGQMPLHTDQWWLPPPHAPEQPPVRPAGMGRGAGGALDPAPAAAVVSGVAVANIMWMITDFTEDNGATVIVPRSHVSGAQPDPQVPHRIRTNAMTGAAGTALVFDGRLWHAAGANRTEQSRYGITCTFCGPQFRPLENYARGLRPEVKARMPPALLRRLGFKAWSTYGHTGDPDLDLSVSGEEALGVLGGEDL